MNVFRAIVVLLISLALPFSAMATMLDTLHCHHDGLGALVDTAPTASMHHCAHHAAMQASPDQPPLVKAAGHSCDCAVKCQCQHHGASGGTLIGMQPSADTPVYTRMVLPAVSKLAFVPATQLQPPLRPPIAALPGAA